MKSLNNKQIRHLKNLAHSLKPVVIIGDKGLTNNVVDEIKQALESHELIKVKIRANDKEERQTMIGTITQRANALKVQRVGHIVSFFKRNKQAVIALPK